MAFREMSMTDVREVLRRWQAGQSTRQIARDRVADRKTAGRYIEAAEALGIERRCELTDEVIAKIAERVQVRSEADPSDGWKALEKHRKRIEDWLAGEEKLRLVRVHELLRRHGVETSYSTLWRFAHQELGWREVGNTVRIDDPPPGEEAQVDFGKMGYITWSDGVRRALLVLIVTLSMSRYEFVWPTRLQTTEALCEGLDAAWSFFGGVVRRIVPDNTTAAIIHPHPWEPVLNRSFLEYAQSRGFFTDAARIKHPKDKPRVENQVPYVRERWFAGERFVPDMSEIRAHAAVWCRDVAGARIHGTTRRVPREVFEAEERQHLLPAPTAPFDVPTWTRAKLHPDHHAQVSRSLYSAPTRFIGKTFDVRIDRSTVRFYLGSELIKLHHRVEPGKRSTDENDYPSEKAAYAFRKIDGVKKRAHELGENVGRYADRLLEGALPWTKMRQGYGLLRLCDRYGATQVDALCARALAFDVIDVPRIERMLKSAQKVEQPAEGTGRVIRLPAGRFARDASAFATMSTAKDEPENGGAR
jgi:transposase